MQSDSKCLELDRCAAAEDHRSQTCLVKTLVKVYNIKESILEQQ